MPTASVDSSGTELFFTDTGPVRGAHNYTTLVIVHGIAFTGETFHRLLPYGKRDKVRVVVVNRRQYDGSSKYSDAELQAINSGHASVLRKLALEVANFLVWFVRTQNIPLPTENKRAGGICLMGWSLGTVSCLSLLSHPGIVPKIVHSKLQNYLRKIILYDPPHCAFGYEKPDQAYDPFQDPGFADNMGAAFDHFCYWATASFDHRGLATRSTSDLDFSKMGQNPAWGDVPVEDRPRFVDASAAATADVGMLYPMQPAIKIRSHKALFDDKVIRAVLPNVELVYLYCTDSFWPSVLTFVEIETQYKEHVSSGRKARPMQFVEMKGANHFVHWANPRLFWTTVVDAMSN